MEAATACALTERRGSLAHDDMATVQYRIGNNQLCFASNIQRQKANTLTEGLTGFATEVCKTLET
jgi:hypothetical protein